MNCRPAYTLSFVLLFALGMAALVFSVAVPASARLYTTPISDPSTPRFTPIDGLPKGFPPQLRAAYEAASRAPHAPTAAPDVRLFTWTPGNQARPGGVMVYSVYFDNFGDADALNVIITDTLPAQTTYAGDTSGLPVSSAGGIVTWTVGTLPAQTSGSFNLTLHVDPGFSVGSMLDSNCIRISTVTSGDDPGNNGGCPGGVTVVNDGIDVYVQTWPNGFFDAAAGQEYPYSLQTCNFSGTPSGPVRITDTLPLSTTYSRWVPAGFWPPLWRLVSAVGNQVVLEAPGFPANTCDEVRLMVLVDAAVPLNTRFLNQLSGYTPGDADPNNNTASSGDVSVRVSRIDLNMQRRVSWDTFGFEADIANAGNTAAPALLTDTLPLSTTLRSGSGSLQTSVRTAITPTQIDSRTIVWNLGVLPVGYSAQLHYALDVDPAVAPAAPLELCGTIAPDVPDDTPWDNTACATTSAVSPGVHLWVAQQHEWRNDYNQLRYELIVINPGDQVLSNLWLTDTYPLFTAMEVGYDVSALAQITDTWDAPNQQRIFWIEQLLPGEYARIWFNVNLDAPYDRPHTYTNTIDYVSPGGPATSAHAATLGEFTNIELRVNAGQIDVWGNALPNVDVRVTAASGSYTTTTGQPWSMSGWNVNAPGVISPGDTLTVSIEGSANPPIVVHVPAPLDATANSATRQITGQVDALDEEPVNLGVNDYLDTTVLTDGAGHFTRTLPMMARGQQGEVIYRVRDDALNVAYHANFASLDLLLTVNASHDWIELNYEVGHTLWLTVTDSLGNVKATLTDVTQIVPWWGGGTGYSTNMGTWSPGQPNIEAGDWIYGALDNGFTSTLKVGTITGVLDQPNATITGTLEVPWIDAVLNAGCWIDGVPGRINFSAASNGGAYVCDFSPEVFHPGDTISVEYEEPTHDRVRYVFRVPGPDVAVNKWTQAQPAAGSRYWYWIEYRNDGDLAATDVILTDTLPAELTYVGDGAHVAPTIVGNQVVWSLGALPPGANRRFPLIVDVAAGTAEGTPLHNEVVATDPDDRDMGNNTQSRDDNVVALDVDLYVGMGNQGDQPTPGEEYVYRIDYGNQIGTGSGPVLLTHTLPVSSTYVSFFSDDPLWTVQSNSGNQVVFARPMIPGWYGAQLLVRLHLDAGAAIGTQLDAQADIATTNETGPLNNNSATYTMFVQDPRLNLALDNQFESGVTVPDHAVTFRMSYHNWGNVPGSGTRITGTLPAGTTFVTSTQQVFVYNQWQNAPFTPLSIDGQQVVWDLDTLPTGTDGQLRVTLHIEPATPIGTVLTYTARIGSTGVDGDERNDVASDSIVVRGAGRNLMVRKSGHWQGDDRIRYDLQFYNVGTSAISGFVLTDTYPISTTLGPYGEFWSSTSTHNAGARQVVWTLPDRVDAGNSGGSWLEVNVDPAIAKGRWLTNTLDISQPLGEITPGDNHAYAVVTTGPDLYVSKTADRATVKPGDLITFTLAFGNQAQRGMDGTLGRVRLFDTLPDGLTYVRATWHDCPTCTVDPLLIAGQQLIFDFDPMPNGWWNMLDVTAQVTTTAQAGDVFVNHASISSNNLVADLDPIASNNASSAQAVLTNPAFEVSKVRSGSGVAGTVITYALSVSNTGNLTGTNLNVIDVVPAGVTYGGGGVFAGGQVSWTLASIGPGLSGSIGWFTGTLTCAANTTITNQQYRVVASDQGITSTNGVLNSFMTITPTINVAFTRSPATLIGSGAVTFTGTTSTDGTALTYAWAFGDGTPGAGLTASHTYTQPGAYTVTLTATDGCGFTKATTASNAVIVYTPVHAAFTSAPVSGIAPVTAVFTNTSTGDFTSSLWNFGDGVTSTLLSLTHTYTSAGVYTVTLSVTGPGGTNTSTVTNAVTVYAPVHAAFTATPTTGTPPLTVNFTNTSTGDFTSSVWSFGDGVTSTLPNPTHVYASVGTYTVTLSISGPGGTAAMTVSNAITVNNYRIMLPLVRR